MRINVNIRLFIIALSLLFAPLAAQAHWVVHDSEGEKVLADVPKRVAALNWDIAEQVIELGVEPVAMPDISGYQDWVVHPPVPASTQDIGTRVEPNYSKLAELKPDVILIASPQKDLTERLEKIAPVLFYQTYSEKHDNAQAAINNFLLIGKALGKEREAQKKLAYLDSRIEVLKEAVRLAYDSQLPKVTAFRFANTNSVYIYGDNSIPQYALSRLGLEPAMDHPSTQWGITQKRLTKLKNIGQGVALYFEPFPYKKRLDNLMIWQAMPFVKNNRVNAVAASWSYGGAMSILYNAEALSQSLIELAPND